MKKIVLMLMVSLMACIPWVTVVEAAEINHDQVVGFQEVSPVTVTQQAAKRFQPFLKVYHGCVPFPAVDQQGNTSAGLNTSGSSNGNCSSSTGQIYSRSAWHNGVWAIMYSWYFPKDSPSSGLGHRHDWEGIVVWVDNPAAANPQILSIAYSGHGQFTKVTPSNTNTQGSHPLISYNSTWPLNHELGVTNAVGGTQPLIGWDDLTSAARNALNTTDFGSANVPFNDNNFTNNLNKAWFR
ncbi:NPP1 family protein [Paenibacillus sp. FSL K6-4396]|uniref:NPP1 family protein n=1 Tax=Paenibacillus sp. FSL K6-4396 TaxID=2921506 RepID=UPI0030F7F004